MNTSKQNKSALFSHLTLKSSNALIVASSQSRNRNTMFRYLYWSWKKFESSWNSPFKAQYASTRPFLCCAVSWTSNMFDAKFKRFKSIQILECNESIPKLPANNLLPLSLTPDISITRGKRNKIKHTFIYLVFLLYGVRLIAAAHVQLSSVMYNSYHPYRYLQSFNFHVWERYDFYMVYMLTQVRNFFFSV